MTAAMPGISDCLDIGDAGPCGGRCDETGAMPGAWRCGGGTAAPGLRSAVNATIAAVTPVIADRTLASVKATPRGDITLAKVSRTRCCVTLNAYLPHARD